jgi:hypothetical protein
MIEASAVQLTAATIVVAFAGVSLIIRHGELVRLRGASKRLRPSRWSDRARATRRRSPKAVE